MIPFARKVGKVFSFSYTRPSVLKCHSEACYSPTSGVMQPNLGRDVRWGEAGVVATGWAILHLNLSM